MTGVTSTALRPTLFKCRHRAVELAPPSVVPPGGALVWMLLGRVQCSVSLRLEIESPPVEDFQPGLTSVDPPQNHFPSSPKDTTKSDQKKKKSQHPQVTSKVGYQTQNVGLEEPGTSQALTHKYSPPHDRAQQLDSPPTGGSSPRPFPWRVATPFLPRHGLLRHWRGRTTVSDKAVRSATTKRPRPTGDETRRLWYLAGTLVPVLVLVFLSRQIQRGIP